MVDEVMGQTPLLMCVEKCGWQKSMALSLVRKISMSVSRGSHPHFPIRLHNKSS